MADLSLAFPDAPVEKGDQIAFVEGVLGIGEKLIELTLDGNVSLSGVVFATDFEGSVIATSIMVPWASGEAAHSVQALGIAISPNMVAPMDYSGWYWPAKVLFEVDIVQTSASKIGFFGWRGRVE